MDDYSTTNPTHPPNQPTTTNSHPPTHPRKTPADPPTHPPTHPPTWPCNLLAYRVVRGHVVEKRHDEAPHEPTGCHAELALVVLRVRKEEVAHAPPGAERVWWS
jgi:hypothetical protein